MYKLHESGGWRLLAVIIFLPILLILLCVDFIIKYVYKGKIIYIWVLEIIAIILIYYFRLYFQ